MVIEVTDFTRDVLEASHERPVVVDFWAPWCGPCRMLGPVLERLAEQNEGAWTLAKLNTDENPEVSLRYAIRSIPAVKLFIDGEVADEFIGALPEGQVRAWLERSIPSGARAQIDDAQRLIDDDRADEAEAQLSQVLATEPDNDDARLLMAKLLVFRDPDAAEELTLRTGDASAALVPLREAVPAVGRLLRLDAAALPEGPAREHYIAALAALRSRDFDAALKGFIDALLRDRNYDSGGARKAALALFALLGERHPAVRKHRRAFDMALF